MIGSKAVDLHEPRASLHTPSGGQANQSLFPPFPQVLPRRMPASVPHQHMCFAESVVVPGRRCISVALHWSQLIIRCILRSLLQAADRQHALHHICAAIRLSCESA